MIAAEDQLEKSSSENPKLKTILVVDDEEMTRDVIAQALKIMGYHPITAEDGLEAIKMIKVSKPDLVITDIHMPKMNGLELLQETKKYDENIPIILITGFDPEEARNSADEYQASALITKPFRLSQLSEVMEKIFSD